MKYITIMLVTLMIWVLFNQINEAQILKDNSTKNKLISYGIDPENFYQVIDSLNTVNDDKRWWLIHWIGEKRIYSAIPELKLLMQKPNTNRFPRMRNMEQKTIILRTIMDLNDTTFHQEFKDEIDSLSKNDINYFDTMLFASYLQKTYNDSYGWQFIKKYFSKEFADTTSVPYFRAQIYNLKPFLSSAYRNEAAIILRRYAVNSFVALDYLAEVNDPETEQLAINMALHNNDRFSRYDASEILKNINITIYINTLKASLNIVTDNRLYIYAGLLRTRNPEVYKYIIDLYNSNEYPSDSSIIIQELDNPFLLNPSKQEAVGNLLDSLISYINQLQGYNWIGGAEFIQELNSDLVECKNYYLSGDTVSSANKLKILSNIIDIRHRDSTYNEFVNKYAYDFLYPQTLFIRQRINSNSILDSLLRLSPTSIQAGGNSFSLTIYGTGFNSQSEAYWNGYPLVTTIISDSILQAYVPSTNIINPDDSVMISVLNPIYRYQNELNFIVSVPQTNPNLLVNLKNSQGTQIPASSVKYYDTSWKDAVNNGDGTFTVITTKPTVSVRVFYEYANQTVNNVPAQNNAYTFHTVNTQVELENSSGQLIDEGTVKYYAGAWRDFGTTTNGVASKELLPVNYSFRITYEYVSKDKQQDLNTNSTVTFSTVLCTVQVKDQQNQPINNADVKYYSGSWRDIGLTDANGEVTKELLPANLSFRAVLGTVHQDVQQDLSVNNVVQIVLNVQ